MTSLKLLAFLYPLVLLTSKTEIKKDILEINKRFYETTTFNMDITSSAYELKSGKLLKTSSMNITQKPGMFYTSDDVSESMANDKYKVSVHHKKKIIAISRLSSKSPDESKKSLQFVQSDNFSLKLDTVLDFYKNIKSEDVDLQTRELTFSFKEGAMEEVKVLYDKKTYKVLQVQFIILNYGEKFKYVLKYSHHKKESITKDLFEEKNYFTIQGKKLILKPKYAKYQLIYNK